MPPADVDTASEEESDHAASAAFRKAKREKESRKRKAFRKAFRKAIEVRGKKGENGNKYAGRTLNCFNRKTGEIDRGFTCSCEYHFAPPCPRKENHSKATPHTPTRAEEALHANTYLDCRGIAPPSTTNEISVEGWRRWTGALFFNELRSRGPICVCALW